MNSLSLVKWTFYSFNCSHWVDSICLLFCFLVAGMTTPDMWELFGQICPEATHSDMVCSLTVLNGR